MTQEEHAAVMAKLTAVQTEADALEQLVRDNINLARKYNQARAEAANKRTALLESAEPLRKAIEQHNIEAAAEQNKRRIAEAEANAAKAKAAAEQAAAEEAAKPKLEDVMRELAELKAKVEGQK
jgi:hypothetical protein